MNYSVSNSTLTYHDDVETIRWADTPRDMDKIKRIVFPSSVKRIRKEVFKEMEALEEVVFSEGLEDIGERAFAGCPRLKEVIFPKGLKDIEGNAFSGCTALERIAIHPGTQEINIWDEAFANCVNLREVELDDTLDYTSFRLNVFKNTTFLTELRKKDPLVIINNEIIDGKECQGDLVIPDYVKGVNCGAFADNTKLTSVVCPDTVEFVSYSAFEGCTSLRKVVLPANMENLSEATFRNCTSLEEVVLPKSEDLHIYGYAFRNTPYQKARQKEGTPFILNGWVVDGSSCKGEVHLSGIKGISAFAFYLNHEITKVVIDEGCEVIDDNAFRYCLALKEVTLPHSMREFGDSLFRNCHQLSKINIPEGIETIPQDAFDSCTSLTALTLPRSLKEIESGAFDNCVKLKKLEIDPKVKVAPRYFEKDDSPFIGRIVTAKTTKARHESYHDGQEECLIVEEEKYCDREDIVVAVIPEGVKVIGNRAFNSCDNLEKVVLPESLEVIDRNAFSNCKKLEEIRLPEHLKEIGANAFDSCEKLKRIAFPKGLKRIGGNTLVACTHLKEVVLPESLEEIGRGCFSGCERLETLSWPANTKTIEEHMFSSCTSLEHVEIPEGVTTMEGNIFQECTRLETIRIPSTMKELAEYAFRESCLEEVVLSEGVETIHSYAFEDCKSLRSINYPSSLKRIEAWAFMGCEQLQRPKDLENVFIDRDAYKRSFQTAFLEIVREYHLVPLAIAMVVISGILHHFFAFSLGMTLLLAAGVIIGIILVAYAFIILFYALFYRYSI